MEPPNDKTELRNFPWIFVRLRCHFCQRKGDARLAVLSWHYGAGATLAQIVAIFMSRCPWDPHNPARKPQKYGMKCGAYCPDIGRTSPPDLPPSMTGLTLIEGGKDDQLPSEQPGKPNRRRIGGD
jgi:hypothetical protein